MSVLIKSVGLVLLLSSMNSAIGLKIIGIFPYEGKSHFFVFKTYLHELARRGHDVTVISSFPSPTPIPNYRDIALNGKVIEDQMPADKASLFDIFSTSLQFLTNGIENCKLLLSNEEVQTLWKTNEKFDVAVTEQFVSDCSLSLAHKLGTPILGLTSGMMAWWHYPRFGLTFSYDHYNPRAGAIERRIGEAIGVYATYEFVKANREADKVVAQYFESPTLEELAKNVKFMLLYSYFPLTGVKLFPPNVVEVGGYHVGKAKPLEGKIKQFIDEAPNGVVYVSFGSLVKTTSLSKDKFDAIIGALSQLKQRVIWKWENETLPGNPKNILPMSWLPQNDILAHPKVLAFYSHAGMLGTTEAIHHGVPMVAMPILGDQPSNAAAIRESGLGVYLDLDQLTSDSLLAALKQVLEPDFRAKVKELSRMWHDRPLSAMDTAIFWTEFAARHSEHSFRAHAAGVPFYLYYSLDVIAVLLLALFLVLYPVVWCCRRRRSKVARKETKENKRAKKNE